MMTTTHLAMMLAALLAAPGVPASSEPAQEGEALLERLIAAFPDREPLTAIDRTADPAELERLSGLNPGRADDIRPVLETFAACESEMTNRMTRNGLLAVVERLGAGKVERLIAFYESEDFHRIGALMGRLERGETLTAADEAEKNRIFADYPLAELDSLMRTELPAMMLESASFDDMMRCSSEKEASLERLGLRLDARPDPAAVTD